MIKGLKFVAIPTRDYDAALAFWTGKMGFTLLADRPVPEGRWIELAIPDHETKIILFTPEDQRDRVGTFFNGAFACNAVQAAYATLKAKGVVFESAPKATPWAHVVRFRDPDGNLFVLLSDPDGSADDPAAHP
jgi:catechol 2,3-dioxygenase-like lactoylglutathione lyase family enzyme